MHILKIEKAQACNVFIVLVLLSACTTLHGLDPADPWESWNRGAQSFNDKVDIYMMQPVAKGYDWMMPQFAHHAVSNFFSNIDDVGVFINDALQGKFTQSGMDTARLLVNTTAGLGGLIDVGAMIDLP